MAYQRCKMQRRGNIRHPEETPWTALVFLHDHWAETAFGYKVLRNDAWPIVKQLWDRYRHDKPETIAHATSNATDLARRFEAQVLALRDAKLITDEQIA